MNTIILIAIAYIAFTSLVLLTFRSLRDRNIEEMEYYDEKQVEAGMLLLQEQI